ncbi:MAG: ABC transporter permease subunit [bacterium]|nr:ABC transporter permease subunit [bacterium]MDZ4299567.1 ABC transporter permease subunit [Candidatus Sungbacteria bacterium]
MKTIWAIAANTFRAAVRDRILHGIAGFAILFILFTLFLGSISLGEELIIIRSIGLGGIYLFGLLITLFLGGSLMHTEIERRTVYLILAKPVSIGQMIIGKFLGLLMSIALVIAVMSVTYLCVVWYQGGGFDGAALPAIGMTILELALFIALTIFFSTFLTPLGATIYAVIVLYIGHSLSLLVQFVRTSGALARSAATAASYLFPNLEKFNIRNEALHHIVPSSASLGFTVIYALCYIALLLALATFMFSSKDL